jgi:hypothetical protein
VGIDPNGNCSLTGQSNWLVPPVIKEKALMSRAFSFSEPGSVIAMIDGDANGAYHQLVVLMVRCSSARPSCVGASHRQNPWPLRSPPSRGISPSATRWLGPTLCSAHTVRIVEHPAEFNLIDGIQKHMICKNISPCHLFLAGRQRYSRLGPDFATDLTAAFTSA